MFPVPIVYGTPERWKTIRKDGFMRDQKNDRAQTPVIVIRRTNMIRNPMTNPSNKYLYITPKSQWNARTAYDRFAVQNGITPSVEYRSVIVPDYVDLNYDVIVWTDRQEQMNDIIEQIHVENEEFWGLRNQFKFRVRIEEYSSQTELPPVDERFVREFFALKVSAYLIPERAVRDFALKSNNSKTFTVKKVVTFFETDKSF
jgi:hypothetical protein